ncbi:MAG: hypothetical protein Q9209_005855 [Squamulea sp. 1 TL-2023]
MTERQAKTGPIAKASSAAYLPVQRSFGSLSSQGDVLPSQQHKALSPMQRWMSEQPGESPYHNIGSVASSKDSWMQSAKPQAKQQTATSSNQATTGTWADEIQAEKTKDKNKQA